MAISHRAQLKPQLVEQAVERAMRETAPDVVRIRHGWETLWDGEDAYAFRVVLSDDASKFPRLRAVANQVREIIHDVLMPWESGVEIRVDFRSESETTELVEAAWN
jgi:hypothetical protein